MLASISYINPQLKKYKEVYKEYTEVNQEYLTALKERSSNNLDAIKTKLNEITYKLDRNNIVGASIHIVLTVLYFVFFQKFNNGQTLGKKIMKIKIDGNLTLFKYFIRSVILHNILINLLKIIFILILKKENYILASNILYVGTLLIEVTIIVMVTMRQDHRGLHDLITGSSVVKA